MMVNVQLISEEEEQFYNVAQMTDLLFGDVTTVNCYASHRLLNEDRTFFKQVAPPPPLLSPPPLTNHPTPNSPTPGKYYHLR
jgi:hypothetical protein